jgi:hypothetical protein
VERYREWQPPEGPLERPDPLSTEAWVWTFVLAIIGLALLGAIFG